MSILAKCSNVTKAKPQWFQGFIYKINQIIKVFFSKVISVICRSVTSIILVTPLSFSIVFGGDLFLSGYSFLLISCGTCGKSVSFFYVCLYCLMLLHLVLVCLVECKVIQYLLYKTGDQLIVVECSNRIGTFLNVLCFWGIGFPLNLLLMDFYHFNFTNLNVFFNQWVDNLFYLCIFFANTTSPLSNSISFARHFWSMYCFVCFLV